MSSITSYFPFSSFRLVVLAARAGERRTGEGDANRKHYESISSCIEQYRLEYEFVEERIREK
jgi:hypothetical protein